MAHAAQAMGAATEEIFDSVSSTAAQPVVSALGIPAGPPQEIPVHTGQFNTFDIKISEQWVPTDVIIWSVNQPSGVLLWSRPIHPTYSNPLLSYMGGIYNAWGGSIDYRFKVAGTAFHAGAIAIVRIPPNRNPNEFNSPADWGAFEYMVIDPKTMETFAMGVSDQRPIAYHYFPFKEDNPLTFGGWIAVYVLIPLNTSATGSQQIAIETFCKPDKNFQFSQLIMPQVNKSVDPFPREYTNYLQDFDMTSLTTAKRLPTRQIFIEPSDVAESFFVANCYTTSGQKMSKYGGISTKLIPDLRIPIDFKNLMKVETKTDSCDFFFYEDNLSIAIPKRDRSVAMIALQYGATTGAESWNADTWVSTWDVDNPKWNVNKAADTMKSEDTVDPYYVSYELDLAYKDNAYAPANSDESIVHFMCGISGTDGVKSIQTTEMTKLFKTGQLSNLFYTGVCAVFVMVSRDENLPLGFVKLYPEGFLAARSTSVGITLKADNINLKFSGFSARTDPLPKNAEYNKNLMLHRALTHLPVRGDHSQKK